MTEIERLEKAILDLHGCKSKHLGAVPVHEKFEGKAVWQGDVELFELENHPKATCAYAWSYKTDTGESRYVAVLGLPPVRSAQNAVQAYIVSENQKKAK